jgi:hypothetical protein
MLIKKAKNIFNTGKIFFNIVVGFYYPSTY